MIDRIKNLLAFYIGISVLGVLIAICTIYYLYDANKYTLKYISAIASIIGVVLVLTFAFLSARYKKYKHIMIYSSAVIGGVIMSTIYIAESIYNYDITGLRLALYALHMFLSLIFIGLFSYIISFLLKKFFNY